MLQTGHVTLERNWPWNVSTMCESLRWRCFSQVSSATTYKNKYHWQNHCGLVVKRTEWLGFNSQVSWIICIRIIQGDHSPDTMKFPDISLTICDTPDHFKCYSYHACTTSVKVNDQTVKLIFNDNDFIVKNQCHQQQHYNYYESFWAIFHDKIFSLIIPWHFHDFWWNSWHFPDQVFQTSGHPGSCWFGYIEDQNCELRTSKLISSWSMLPPELKKISLTVGQFSSQLKMKMFLCIHYASAQPPHCNYYNCALLIHMNTVQLYNIAVSNGIIENASSKWIW